jgi:hypothetical protein
MTPFDDAWSPEPDLLAAYFDGELDGQPDLAELRDQVSAWLSEHPEAYEVLGDYCRLSQLWRATTPPDPGPAVWRELEERVCLHVQRPTGRWRRARRVATVLASAAAVMLALWLGFGRRAPQDAGAGLPQPPAPPIVAPEIDVLPVATAAEITIIRVEGADTQTVVIGELPVHGALELLGPGEAALTSVQPDARDRMMPHVRMGGGHRPMIWARVEPEDHDP